MAFGTPIILTIKWLALLCCTSSAAAHTIQPPKPVGLTQGEAQTHQHALLENGTAADPLNSDHISSTTSTPNTHDRASIVKETIIPMIAAVALIVLLLTASCLVEWHDRRRILREDTRRRFRFPSTRRRNTTSLERITRSTAVP